jgi:hypothetical protein
LRKIDFLKRCDKALFNQPEEFGTLIETIIDDLDSFYNCIELNEKAFFNLIKSIDSESCSNKNEATM